MVAFMLLGLVGKAQVRIIDAKANAWYKQEIENGKSFTPMNARNDIGWNSGKMAPSSGNQWIEFYFDGLYDISSLDFNCQARRFGDMYFELYGLRNGQWIKIGNYHFNHEFQGNSISFDVNFSNISGIRWVTTNSAGAWVHYSNVVFR